MPNVTSDKGFYDSMKRIELGRASVIIALLFLLTLSCKPKAESEINSVANQLETQQTQQVDRCEIELGVWQDLTDHMYSVEKIKDWLKPFYQAGITNFYICSSPEMITRFVKASRSFDGMKIHAWIFALNACNDPDALAHREWFEINRIGQNSLDNPPYVKIYKWLSPAVPEARQWVKDKAAKYAAIDGLESVHLDFIRFNDLFLGRWSQQKVFHIDQTTYEARYDFGYHPKAIAAFKAKFGYSPLDLSAPWMSPEWNQFRMDEVTSLVNEIVEETHSRGKEVSAAVFPFPERARMMVLQNWPAWNVDAVCAMNYHTVYLEKPQWHQFSVESGLQETHHLNKYIAGIFIHNINGEEIYNIAKLSIDAGADGINFFSANPLKKGDKLKYIKKIKKELCK